MQKMKHKKLIAAAMALMLAASALAGCGASDLGFFSLYNEMSELNSVTISGDLEIEYNPGAMYSYYYSYIEDEPIKLKFSVSGDVEYSGLSDLYLDLKIKYGIDSKDTPHEANLRFFNNVLYMPAEDYIELMIEMKRQDGMSDRMCNSLKNAFLKRSGEYDYVILADTADIYRYLAFSGAAMYAEEIIAEGEEIQQLLYDTLMEAFSGFNSGVTKPISNGYAIEITPETAVGFIDNLYKYVMENKARIHKELIKLYDSLQEYSVETEPGDYEYDEDYEFDEDYDNDYYDYDQWYPLGSIASDKAYYDEMIDGISEAYKLFGPWEHEYYKLLFKGSHLNMQLTKNGGKYTQGVDMDLQYRGKPLFSMKGSISQTINNDIEQETAQTSNPVSLDDLDTLINKTEKEINYVKKAELSWWKWSYYDKEETSRWTSVSFELVEGRNSDYMEMYNEGGTVYVPMRRMLEWFAEEVTWDNAVKKAYVLKAGEKIEMDGKIIDDKMYIRVREFEKLGYTVDYKYDAEWGEHTVSIIKN